MKTVGTNYRYKGKMYTVQREVKFKHPETREWIDAILYKSWGDGAKFYVREREDFLRRFEVCDGKD